MPQKPGQEIGEAGSRPFYLLGPTRARGTTPALRLRPQRGGGGGCPAAVAAGVGAPPLCCAPYLRLLPVHVEVFHVEVFQKNTHGP
jgi:hypothetical protein